MLANANLTRIALFWFEKAAKREIFRISKGRWSADYADVAEKKHGINLRIQRNLQANFLLYNPQLSIVQHDLLLSIQIKIYSSYGIVCCSFHLHYFAKTKFLVLYFIASL
jgi:hypothetical protein